MPRYITASELLTYPLPGGIVVDLSAYTTAQLELIIDRMESQIDSICNDKFAPSTETHLFNGSFKDTLFFPPKVPYKLNTLTSCQEVEEDGTTVVATYALNDDIKAFPHYITFFNYSPTVRKYLFKGGIFPKGVSNIKIVGSWGHATTPPDIKYVAAMLSFAYIAPEVVKFDSPFTKRVQWDDFEIEFKERMSPPLSNGTGFLQLDHILSRYINRSDLFLTTNRDPELRHQYGVI